MTINSLVGKPAERQMLVNVPGLVSAYYAGVLAPSVPGQGVAFSTSGHRGSSLTNSFKDHLKKIIDEAQTIVNAALLMN